MGQLAVAGAAERRPGPGSALGSRAGEARLLLTQGRRLLSQFAAVPTRSCPRMTRTGRSAPWSTWATTGAYRLGSATGEQVQGLAQEGLSPWAVRPMRSSRMEGASPQETQT